MHNFKQTQCRYQKTDSNPMIRKNQQGFSLIEVMIAALVISIGLLGLAGLQLVSMKGTHQSYMRHQATFLVQDIVERIRSNPTQIANYNNFDSANGGFACPAVKNCNTSTNCNANDIVAYDKSSLACGLNQRLNKGRIRVSCNAACTNNDINIQVSWIERNFGKEVDASDVDNDGSKRTDNIILNTIILGP